MNGLREKFRNKKGFTLIEMLIVVAIIAILIAVSIPLVGSALEKARDATDQANERAAKAEAAILYLGVGDETLTFSDAAPTVTRWYDAEKGKLVKDATAAKSYGRCTGCGNTDYAHSDADHKEQVIQVVISKDGSVDISWVAKASAKP